MVGEINLSYYDVTQIDYCVDSTGDGIINNAGGSNFWTPLAVGFQNFKAKLGENRIEHRGNQQTLSIDKRSKLWLDWTLQLLALKYDSTSPAWSWWDIIHRAFYGGATGAQTARPGEIGLGVKYNRTTPEYLTAMGCKIESVTIRGSMVEGPMVITLQGMGKYWRMDTQNYVLGTSTRRSDPAKSPIIPSNDCTIKVNNIDESANIQEFVLTLRRAYEKRGRSATAADSSTQIGKSGLNYREFVPNTFDGRLSLVMDPYGTTTKELTQQIADTALNTVELQAENTTNGKQIQFTASKEKNLDMEAAEGRSPNVINLDIDGSTFNVNTL